RLDPNAVDQPNEKSMGSPADPTERSCQWIEKLKP
ncbi:unnamed protein product, partial [marine sediment metagenome]